MGRSNGFRPRAQRLRADELQGQTSLGLSAQSCGPRHACEMSARAAFAGGRNLSTEVGAMTWRAWLCVTVFFGFNQAALQAQGVKAASHSATSEQQSFLDKTLPPYESAAAGC